MRTNLNATTTTAPIADSVPVTAERIPAAGWAEYERPLALRAGTLVGLAAGSGDADTSDDSVDWFHQYQSGSQSGSAS
ncbi:hypothetical protein [Streptomyces millisiae]|uniref:Uncharacterized protein n=1 Tax=Streptomyces millisiae TaxID=3075542 RepID=A0ABU2LWC4_9ACTN|nr:hypothetical protein [Streptomyces sp. DSM 44918]MDT0321869.1 hypothetical protein [Streptomyces sp. DSM 44918]